MLGPRSISTRHTLTPPPSSRNSRPHRPQTESTPSPHPPPDSATQPDTWLPFSVSVSVSLSHTHHHVLSHFTLLIKLSTPCQIGWPLPCPTATILVQVDLVSPGTTRTPPPRDTYHTEPHQPSGVSSGCWGLTHCSSSLEHFLALCLTGSHSSIRCHRTTSGRGVSLLHPVTLFVPPLE